MRPADEAEHVLHDLIWRCDMPNGKGALAAVPDGGGEDRIAPDSKLDGLVLDCVVLREQRHGERGFHDRFLDCLVREEQERAEHVLIGL